MAGSLETFVYTSDTGAKYLIRLDESNATSAGFTEAVEADLSLPVISSRLTVRVVNCISATGIRRRIPAPSVTSPIWLGTKKSIDLLVVTGLTAKSVPFSITSRTGEKERYLTVADTGQTDQAGQGQSPL